MIIFTITDDDQDRCCLRPVTQSVNPAGAPLLMSLKWTKTAPHRDTKYKYKIQNTKYKIINAAINYLPALYLKR